MKGNYTKNISINEDLVWSVFDEDNTIAAGCSMDHGQRITVASVINALPAFSTFNNHAEYLKAFFKKAASLSLGIPEENIVD